MRIRFPRIPYLWLLIAPWLLFGVGFTLNAIAMAVNGAQMPVLFPNWDPAYLSADDFRHAAMTAHTHLKFLCDWIVVKDVGTFSVGDFLLLAFGATWQASLGAWAALTIKKATRHDQ